MISLRLTHDGVVLSFQLSFIYISMREGVQATTRGKQKATFTFGGVQIQNSRTTFSILQSLVVPEKQQAEDLYLLIHLVGELSSNSQKVATCGRRVSHPTQIVYSVG